VNFATLTVPTPHLLRGRGLRYVVSEPPPHGPCVRRLSPKERAIAAGVTSYVPCYGCSRPMAPLTSPFTLLRLRDARRAPSLATKTHADRLPARRGAACLTLL